MRNRIWKRPTEPKCGAEMKVGIQVHKGLTCQLPDGHEGRHQASTLTTWGRSTTEHQPGAKEDL